MRPFGRIPKTLDPPPRAEGPFFPAPRTGSADVVEPQLVVEGGPVDPEHARRLATVAALLHEHASDHRLLDRSQGTLPGGQGDQLLTLCDRPLWTQGEVFRLDRKKEPSEVEKSVFIGRERELSQLDEFLKKMGLNFILGSKTNIDDLTTFVSPV